MQIVERLRHLFVSQEGRLGYELLRDEEERECLPSEEERVNTGMKYSSNINWRSLCDMNIRVL